MVNADFILLDMFIQTAIALLRHISPSIGHHYLDMLPRVVVILWFISYSGVYHLEFWVINPYMRYGGVSPQYGTIFLSSPILIKIP